MSFARPASSRSDDDVRFQDLEGSLLVVVVLRMERNVPSSNGETFDAVVCDVYACDGPHTGQVFPGMWMIGKALQSQLEPHVGGQPVLGRLHKPQGKRYRLLSDPTPAEETAALAAWPQFAEDAPPPAERKRNPSLPTKKESKPEPEPVLDDAPPF